MGDLHEDRDIISPLYSVTLLANHPACRLGRPLAPVDSNDTAPGLEADGYDTTVDWLMSRKPWYLLDVDHDRPSPGDDTTRAAFDAMDGTS